MQIILNISLTAAISANGEEGCKKVAVLVVHVLVDEITVHK